MIIHPKSKCPRKERRKASRKASRKGTRKASRKRATMGKFIINIPRYPIDIDINEIRENYFGIVSEISDFEKTVDVDLLDKLLYLYEASANPDDEIAKSIIDCANDSDDETAECINYVREIKEMFSIIKLEDSDIEEKLDERLELRKERIFKLIYLTKISGFHSEYEILEKIDKIVKETGGLQVDLHFDTPEYEGLLGSEIINLYKKYKESINIKSRDKIRESSFLYLSQFLNIDV